MEVTLRALARPSAGKGSARQTRIAGRVPAVLYGQGMDALSLSVDAKQMGQALHTHARSNVLVNLEVEGGSSYLTMVREVQKHPVRNYLIHVDFVATARDIATHASVPVHVVGESIGIRLGGMLENQLWELAVEALPTDIPDAIEVDITDLNVGDHLLVGDIKAPRGVTIVTPAEEIVLSIVAPTVATTDEEAAEGEAPEL